MIKKGPESSVLITPQTKAEVPGFKVEVIDAVGDGDRLTAGISCLIDQLSPQEILTSANALFSKSFTSTIILIHHYEKIITSISS